MPKAKVITGKVRMDVTLPAGVTADAFVKDDNVKKGVQKGIAANLGLTGDQVNWIVVTLSVVSSRRLADAATKASRIDAAYVITVPAASVGSDEANDIEAAVGPTATMTAAKMTTMAESIMTQINEETKAAEKAYKVAIVSMVKADVAEDTTPSGTGTPSDVAEDTTPSGTGTPSDNELIEAVDSSRFGGLTGLLVVIIALVHLAF